MYYRTEQIARVAICDIYSRAARSEKTRAFKHHNHEALEILCVRRGTLRVTVDNREHVAYEGDTVVVNPYCVHFGEWRTDEDGEYICLILNLERMLSHFSESIRDVKNELLNGKGAFEELCSDVELHDLIESIERDFDAGTAAEECRLSCELFALFELLFKRYYRRVESEKPLPRDVDFMKRVTAYISEKYTENISTSDIAGEFYMSSQNFCYNFRRYFGKSFRNALCEYRLARAVDIYTQQKIPFSQLAERVGFLDYCYFSRAFRKQYGQSPAVYFEKRKKSGERDESDPHE